MTDLELCENQPEEFEIDMAVWLRGNSHCRVCFAGSVMAQEFGLRHTPTNDAFSSKEWIKFRALDLVRRGYLFDAVYAMNGENPFTFSIVYDYTERIPSYVENKEEWKELMCSIIGILQAEGY